MRDDCRRQLFLRILSLPIMLVVRRRTTGTVVLMFDAWTAKGELKYRGTDLMVVRDGLVERIVTVNHKSETVFSPKSTL